MRPGFHAGGVMSMWSLKQTESTIWDNSSSKILQSATQVFLVLLTVSTWKGCSVRHVKSFSSPKKILVIKLSRENWSPSVGYTDSQQH